MSEPVSPNDYVDLFQKMTNPTGHALQSLMFPKSPEEIEKKIAELQAVRSWLQTNLGLLDISIKTLEYQRVLLSHTKTHTEKSGGQAGLSMEAMNPALWAVNMMQQASEQIKNAMASSQSAAKGAATPQTAKTGKSARATKSAGRKK